MVVARRIPAVRAGTMTPFTIPGHKQRTDLVGDVVRGDVPLYAGLDTMKQDAGLLAEAERRAAAAWGVDWGRLSVAGSTHANQAVLLDTRHTAAYCNQRALVHLAAGEPELAVADYAIVLQLDPTNITALIGREQALEAARAPRLKSRDAAKNAR